MEKKRNRIGKEMLQLDLHFEIVKSVTIFCQDVLIHAHYFAADACKSSWGFYYKNLRVRFRWNTSGPSTLPDGREQAWPYTNVNYPKGIPRNDIFSVSARSFLNSHWFSSGEYHKVLCRWGLLYKLFFWQSRYKFLVIFIEVAAQIFNAKSIPLIENYRISDFSRPQGLESISRLSSMSREIYTRFARFSPTKSPEFSKFRKYDINTGDEKSI